MSEGHVTYKEYKIGINQLIFFCLRVVGSQRGIFRCFEWFSLEKNPTGHYSTRAHE